MDSIPRRKKWAEGIALAAIAVMSFFYVRFQSSFAELHIQFSFLDFPIFVGEGLLFICLACFLLKYKGELTSLFRQHYPVILFFIFVFIKMIAGYVLNGPLALRHAALFYYPIFAVFGYSFFNINFIRRGRLVFCLLVLLLFIQRGFYPYWILTLFIFGLIMIQTTSDKRFKYLMTVFLLIFTPYTFFFNSARMMIVANAVVFLFWGFVFFAVVPMKRRYKIALLCVSFLSMGFGFYKFGDPTAIKTTVDFRSIGRIFCNYEKEITERQKRRSPVVHQIVRLYNPNPKKTFERNISRNVMPDVSSGWKTRPEGETPSGNQQEKAVRVTTPREIGSPESREEIRIPQKKPKVMSSEEEVTANTFIKQDELDSVQLQERPHPQKTGQIKEIFSKLFQRQSYQRKTSTAFSNAVFRLFIWRDMIEEYVSHPSVFGFMFGHPVRSKSLETLNWGSAEWERDGWVAPHNSYLHILYRSGIVGLVFIGYIFCRWFAMTKMFVRQKSYAGILVCGIILSWFIAANFLVVLELPYTAIPIWCLYGFTMAYAQQIKKE